MKHKKEGENLCLSCGSIVQGCISNCGCNLGDKKLWDKYGRRRLNGKKKKK